MNSTMLADLADPPQRRAHPHWVPGLVVLLLAFSAIGAVLLTHVPGATLLPLAASGAPSLGAPSLTLASARDDACACTRRSVAASGAAWRMGLPREPRGAAHSPAPGGALIPPGVASAGAARTGMWIMHNKEVVERDPREFLRLMSYQARRHEPKLIRFPGEGPMAKPGPAVAETPPSVLPVIQQGPR